MDGKLIICLTLLVLLASPSKSFPTGACADLRPRNRHGDVSQSSASPYELDVSIFEDLGSEDGFAIPVTYSYSPSTTYNRKFPKHLIRLIRPRYMVRGVCIQWTGLELNFELAFQFK